MDARLHQMVYVSVQPHYISFIIQQFYIRIVPYLNYPLGLHQNSLKSTLKLARVEVVEMSEIFPFFSSKDAFKVLAYEPRAACPGTTKISKFLK
jgi:hypothetical protein